MKDIRSFLVFFLCAASLTSCIKKVNVATRAEKAILVVEGSITTDSTPYTVKLSYSGPFNLLRDIPDQNFVKDAIVKIIDDLGNSTDLIHTVDGIYQTTDPSYVGKVGRSYTVNIQLKDGKKYISKAEKIAPLRPIKKVSAEFVNDFNIEFPTYLRVRVDADDPPNEENYYQWSFFSNIMRETKGVPCGFSCIQFIYCYQEQIDREVRILSDNLINGNQIRNQEVGKCYIYTYGNPYIEIGQHSISREAYQFLQRYKDQLSRTGSILDPLPASIKGNIFNASDSADFALGYFSASSVYRKKMILIPYGITDYLLTISAKQHIPEDNIACFDYYPNAMPYLSGSFPPPPPGWENAEELKVFW